MIVVGGLNPIAAIEEAGIPTASTALAGLYDFTRLVDYRDLTQPLYHGPE